MCGCRRRALLHRTRASSPTDGRRSWTPRPAARTIGTPPQASPSGSTQESITETPRTTSETSTAPEPRPSAAPRTSPALSILGARRPGRPAPAPLETEALWKPGCRSCSRGSARSYRRSPSPARRPAPALPSWQHGGSDCSTCRCPMTCRGATPTRRRKAEENMWAARCLGHPHQWAGACRRCQRRACRRPRSWATTGAPEAWAHRPARGRCWRTRWLAERPRLLPREAGGVGDLCPRVVCDRSSVSPSAACPRCPSRRMGAAHRFA
mmetsp:Transcript_15101/g.43514  ORF Transcript_15101/g.43514 Transcript_15101/m.43514 type:complete len:267 (-) Transcript_15101:43-843(-)